ncbi:MAG: MarR family transcriptional regulator [Candidatus Riflebacteria bacterium]
MATKFNGNKNEKLALDAFIKLIRASNSVSYDCNAIINSRNLTESQFGVLEALYHLGPMSQKQLSEKLLKSGGNMTMVVDNLVKYSLVERQKNNSDRRFYIIVLTESGRKLITEMLPDHVALITRRMNSLNENELQILGDLCRKLGLARFNNR